MKRLTLDPDPHMRWIYDCTHPDYNTDMARDLRARRDAAIRNAPKWMLEEAMTDAKVSERLDELIGKVQRSANLDREAYIARDDVTFLLAALRELSAAREALRVTGEVLDHARKYLYHHQRPGDRKGMQLGHVPTVYPEDIARLDALRAKIKV